MTINGNRKFKFNGRKYYIADLPKADRQGKKKYFIMIEQCGAYKIAYNNFDYSIDKFETIKEAQRYVRDWDWTLVIEL